MYRILMRSSPDVRKLVVDSHKKSCYLDPVPTDFLVKCLDVLLPVITKIINISLETGYFPRDWKEAIILPILKKSGLESAFENLRPISNEGADYMESFQPGLSFIPVSRAEISARPKDKVLLKHSKRLHDQNSSPG